MDYIVGLIILSAAAFVIGRVVLSVLVDTALDRHMDRSRVRRRRGKGSSGRHVKNR